MNLNRVFVQSMYLNDVDMASILCSSLISQQVINESAQFEGKRQKQFVACRYLLAKLLYRYYSVPCLPDIVINHNNRPKFQQQGLPDFNISHSGDFIAVAVCSQGSVGLDIEFKRSRKNFLMIANQFFSVQENNWLTQQEDKLSAFWQLWTLRESALKLYAKGVWQMKELKIDMPQQQISAGFATAFHARHYQLEKIYLSVCCSESINSIIVSETNDIR